jgi:uncharacterized protein
MAMLRYDARALRQGPVPTEAAIPPGDAVFAELALRLDGPVLVGGTLRASGPDTFIWQGNIAGVSRGECRRCLTGTATPFAADVVAVFSAAADAADDAAVYPLAAPVTWIDLAPAVREEVVLAAPAFPLCREECAGLCPRCGENLNEGPCACVRSPEPV